MNQTIFPPGPERQRGAASIAIAMLLMFMLAAAVIGVTKISGSAVQDAATNEEQIAALFLAESGLERARSQLNSNTPLTTCTSSGNTSLTLGRGSFVVTSTVETITTPLPCSVVSPCYSCVVKSVGTVNTTTRTVSQRLGIGTIRGAGTGVDLKTDVLKLVNPYTYPVIAFLNAGLSMGGSATKHYGCLYGATTPPATTCPANWEKWFSVSNVQSNNPGANNFAVAIPLAASEIMYVQFEVTTNNIADVYAVTGGLFRCRTANGTTCADTGYSAAGDTIKGYWKDNIDPPNTILTVVDPSQTGYSSTYFGRTNSGLANTAAACSTPAVTMNFSNIGDASHTPQVCTNWCLGGDTLVFGIAPIMNSTDTDTTTSITSVTFGTDTAGGHPAQNVMMGHIVTTGPSSGWGPDSNPLASYPPKSNPTTNNGYAGTSIYSQTWIAYNRNLSPISDINAGSFNLGEMYRIITPGTTSFTALGAGDNNAGTAFVANAAGSGTGVATHLPFAYNASSYKGNGTGAIGATWTGNNNSVTASGAVLNVGSFANFPIQAISQGDVVSSSGGSGASWTSNNSSTDTVTISGTLLTVSRPVTGTINTGDTVTSTGGSNPNISNVTVGTQVTPLVGGEALGGIGRYNLIGNATNVANANNRSWTTTPSNINNVTIGTQVTPLIAGEALGGVGRYNLSGNAIVVASLTTRTWTTTSSVLNVNCIVCFIENGDPIQSVGFIANKSINSQLISRVAGGMSGGNGTYSLTSSGNPALPTFVAPVDTLKIGTPGTTIYLPSTPTPSMPPVPPGGVAIQPDEPLTRIAVYSNSSRQLVTAGSFTLGSTYEIKSAGTTTFTAIGAANNTVGTIFTATGAGSGTGTASPSPKDVAAGSFVVGRGYEIKTVGNTNFTTIGAVGSVVGSFFIATGVGTGTGTAIPAGMLSTLTSGGITQGTTVSAINTDPNAATKSFTVSLTPLAPLDRATICAGTCAFFNNPDDGSVVSTTTGTQFSVKVKSTPSNIIKQYAGGFTCFANFKPSDSLPFTQFNIQPGHWTEVVE